jgi:hypothetical protein
MHGSPRSHDGRSRVVRAPGGVVVEPLATPSMQRGTYSGEAVDIEKGKGTTKAGAGQVAA